MKAENLNADEMKAETARGETPEAALASKIWSTSQGHSQPPDTASKHLNGMQIADGGGVYIKFTEGRGLSEVGAYVTTNASDGQLTLMGGIELNGRKANEYLLGFDYKDVERHERKERSGKAERSSDDDFSSPNRRPDSPVEQDQRPDRPNRPNRPNRPGK